MAAKTSHPDFPKVDITVGKLRVANVSEWNQDKSDMRLIVTLEDYEVRTKELSIYLAAFEIPSFTITAMS